MTVHENRDQAAAAPPRKGRYAAQLTGMRGVYLVAAELSAREFVVSPTSRNAQGTDLLATDIQCRKAFSIQVKTNATNFAFWLVDEHDCQSGSHIYVFVNLKKSGQEYFVVPSTIVSGLVRSNPSKQGTMFREVHRRDIEGFQDNWGAFDAAI